MNFKNKILILVGTTLLSSCTGYLDVVPDDVATIDHALQIKRVRKNFCLHVILICPIRLMYTIRLRICADMKAGLLKTVSIIFN